MKFLALIILITTIGISDLYSSNSILATNRKIEYSGRIDFRDPESPTFSFSGISIRACFTGHSISAILTDEHGENYYNVLVDGEVYNTIQLKPGKQHYQLAANLSEGNHEIELFKRTELSFGKTTFHGFELEDGERLKKLKNKRKLFFEFIGNSITCGYGNEGVLGEDFLAETENHFMTYAAITSRNFNARHMAVSRSGIGVYRNYNGPKTGNEDCMTNLYENIYLYNSSLKYKFQKRPDVVFINLGTNDFSTEGPDTTLYIQNYGRLIDNIQSNYRKPNIICLLGSMMSGEQLILARECIQKVVRTANAKGAGAVYFFEMSEQKGEIGVHYHPTVTQHKINATELSTFLESELKLKRASSK